MVSGCSNSSFATGVKKKDFGLILVRFWFGAGVVSVRGCLAVMGAAVVGLEVEMGSWAVELQLVPSHLMGQCPRSC